MNPSNECNDTIGVAYVAILLRLRYGSCLLSKNKNKKNSNEYGER